MASVENKLHRDGLLAAIGGQDSGRNASLLHPTQYSFGVNVMCRGGYLKTRYGIKKHTLDFENDEQQDWYEDNLFQGADAFVLNETTGMLVGSVGGRIFKIDVLNGFQASDITPVRGTATASNFISPPTGGSVTVSVADNSTIHVGYPLTIGDGRYLVTAKAIGQITITNLDATPGVLFASGTPVYYLRPNSSLLPHIWTLQAENYFLIQNGSDACIIYDGATSRRSVRSGLKLEVPTGTSMCYANGRIHVAVNRREIELGDIYGGPTSIIDFTETLYLAEGGKFRVPKDITALKVAPVLDTSLGQGPVQIHTTEGIYTLNLPVDRLRWKDLTTPIQTVSLINYGATSQFGTVVVNGDAFFRATDGLRSFIMARRDFGTWGNVPVSREMSRILSDDDTKFLQHGSAVLFDNLLLFTVNPLPIESGRAAYWQGLGVLDFDLISSMGQRSPPVYAGMWNGVNVMQIVKGTFAGVDRCFLFVRSEEGVNELWEMDPKSRFDNECGRIKCRVETRAMDFGMPKGLHQLHSAEVWVDQVHGEVDFSLQFRRDQSPCWVDWGTPKTACAVNRECAVGEGDCFGFKTFQPGYKTRIGFGRPPDSCEAYANSPDALGYEHEFAIEWEGYARLKSFIVKAYERTETAAPPCE
jgi:hypothetical protein